MLKEVFNLQNYHWNPWSIPQLISSVFFLSLGIFVFLKNRKSKVNIFFFMVCLTTFAWFFGLFMAFLSRDENPAFFWLRIVYGGIIFIPISFYHFMINLFPELKWWKKPIPLIHISNIILFLFLWFTRYYITPQRYFWGWYGRMQILEPLFLVSLFAVAVTSLFFLYTGYRSGKYSVIKLRQMRYVFWAISIYVLSSVDFLPTVGIGIYPFGFIFNAIFIGIVGFTIVRYRLMEIDTVVHKTLLWSTTILLLVFPAALVEIFLRRVIPPVNIWLNLIIVSSYILVIVSYYTRLRPYIDNIFRRRRYDYQTILGKVAEKIATTINIEDLARQLLTEVCETMYLRNSLLHILTKDEKKFSLVGRRGYKEMDGVRQRTSLELYTEKERHNLPEGIREIEYESAFFKWLMIHQDVLEREQMEIDPRYTPIKQEAANWFKENEVELIVPLVFEGKVHAIMGLGKKENLQAYNIKDIELLKKLGQEAGVTVFNALHYEDLAEKERLDEEMRMGREIQMALLPRQAPAVLGLVVQGIMQPAKEIGGDYYDFLTLPDKDALAIIIGDVSGKGVAAGLLMAMAKTAIHTLSRQELSPRQILLRTNQILFQNIGGQKFMTLLYLLWHSKERTFTYSSAGHEHILIYHSRNGELETIQSGGFMLGMIDEIEKFLEEKNIVLERGDKILLYTDGVTEAQDKTGERYGLGRLKETFKRHSQKSASGLLHAIKDEIYAFIGDHPQYDDITLVVLEAQ